MKSSWARWGILLSLLSSVGASAETRPIGSELLWDELSEGQRARVMAKELVAMKLRVPGSDWPNTVGYHWVDATPEQAAAVFAAYNLQSTYIPKVLESRVSRVITPDHVFVDYKVSTGYFGITSAYTVENQATRIASRGEYHLKWDRVTASHASAIDGMVRVQPHAGGTLFFYQLYTVIPSGPFSSFVKEKGFESFKDTVQAIIKRIQAEKGTELLDQQVADLRVAVGKPESP